MGNNNTNVHYTQFDITEKSGNNHPHVSRSGIGRVTLGERYFLLRVFQGLSVEESAVTLKLDSKTSELLETQLLRELRGVQRCS